MYCIQVVLKMEELCSKRTDEKKAEKEKREKTIKKQVETKRKGVRISIRKETLQ